jgi:hypothetical protein
MYDDEPIMVDEDGIPMDDLPDDYPDPPWANCESMKCSDCGLPCGLPCDLRDSEHR